MYGESVPNCRMNNISIVLYDLRIINSDVCVGYSSHSVFVYLLYHASCFIQPPGFKRGKVALAEKKCVVTTM